MKKLIACLVITSLLLIPVSCTAVETGAEAETANASSTQDGDEAIQHDAEVYAKDQGVSVDEAIRRFELLDDAGPLQALIKENEVDTYAGSWIQHQPEYKFVFAFTRDSEETIKKYVKDDSPLAGLIELRTFEVSYQELRAEQEETTQLLKNLNLDVFCATGINVQENRAEVYVTDSKLFNEILQEANVQLPPHVAQVLVYEPLEKIPFQITPDPSVRFPQLKMRGGMFYDMATTGILELKDGYLRLNGELVIWQPDYFVNSDNGTIEILDRDGKVVAKVGEEVSMGVAGPFFETVGEVNRYLKEPLPEDVAGPFLLLGDSIKLNLNFSSDLFSIEITRFEDHDFNIFKKKPRLDEMVTKTTEITGKLVASHDGIPFRYPYIYVDEKPEENKTSVRYTTLWPASYKARVEEGVFEITDEFGDVIVRDGEEVKIEGSVLSGISSDITSQLYNDLPEGCYQPYLIVNTVLRK